MNRLRSVFSAVCIAATLGSAAIASAAEPAATPNAPPMRHGWHEEPGGPGGGLHRTLDKLDLSKEQTAQVQAIFDAARPQMHAVRESGRVNREKLLSTPPTDPGYAALIASAKANAAEQIQLMSDLWAKVYEKLTPDQRARIPEVVAAQWADRDSSRPRRGQPPPSP
jgi:Spy/CpxP family protein refolding chaperone